MNIILNDYYENLVQMLIQQGRYTDSTEVVRAGLRALETTGELPPPTALHQEWIDESLADGPAEEKTQADWNALKDRVLKRR